MPEEETVETQRPNHFDGGAKDSKRGPIQWYKHRKCVKNVGKCLQEDPLLHFLIGGMSTFGCNFDPDRHIACEPCKNTVSGGYDASVNQAVVCENYSTRKQDVNQTLRHELIHMYDHCRANLDFSNLEHLACTEIRASNLADCKYFPTKFNEKIKDKEKAHQACVKRRAMISMMTTRGITPEKATAIIDKVFDRCINDTSPFGRVPNTVTRKLHIKERANMSYEASTMGYVVFESARTRIEQGEYPG